MQVLVVIPARYGSSRLPGKPLAPITSQCGTCRTLIEWTWRAGVAAVGPERTIVATDDGRIATEVERFGGRAVLTDPALRNGTERCAAAVNALGAKPDAVVNLQGDSPLVSPQHIADLIDAIGRPEVSMATPYVTCDAELTDMILQEHASGRVGGTCVVTREDGTAAYFSKLPIPSGASPALPLKLHIGLYAYRPAALDWYLAKPPSPLELAEGLEQLRFVEGAWPVTAIEVARPERGIWEVNNPDDLAIVGQRLTN